MKLCILDDAYDDSTSPMKDVDIPTDVDRYLGNYELEHHFLTKRTAVRKVTELAGRDFDVFVNLCDGAWDEDRPGVEVVQTLEMMNVAFTGADSNFYDPSRQTMKKVAHYYGIRTPAGVFASGERGIEKALRTLSFPLIAKHPNSYSSIGMTRRSRVETPEALREQASKMIAAYGSVLIEEFIEGREYNVLVAENPDDPMNPITYEPVEFRFPDGETFKHFDMKWRQYGDMVSISCGDTVLARELKEISSAFFAGLKGTGYGRCDIRVDADGRPFMLEINPNCGIFYPPHAEGSADLILDLDPEGHDRFVETILRSARNRVSPPPKWTLELDEERAFGLYALTDLSPGAVIYEHEESAHVLVTRSVVENTWDDRRKRWFGRFAYPLTDEIYVMWSDDPEEWKPINHSCDPNAWLDGLDLVARRHIAAGEEITIDYATFCNEVMEPFKCSCGSAQCRGIIRGTDYLEPFVDRYGDHVSDYVKSKRKTFAWEVETDGRGS